MEKGRFLSLVKLETGTSTEEKRLDSSNKVENDTKEALSKAVPAIKKDISPPSLESTFFLIKEIEFNVTFSGRKSIIL